MKTYIICILEGRLDLVCLNKAYVTKSTHDRTK